MTRPTSARRSSTAGASGTRTRRRAICTTASTTGSTAASVTAASKATSAAKNSSSRWERIASRRTAAPSSSCISSPTTAWAHSYNDAGDQFGGTANGAPIFFGGIPATAYAEGSRGMTAKKINVVDTCHTITPNFRQVDVFGGYTAAAGSELHLQRRLPKRVCKAWPWSASRR
jgi:hypothetical protein